MTLAEPADTLRSTSPGTGELVATYPVDGPEAVAAAVGRARGAAGPWAALGFAGRAERLTAWRGHIARHFDDLAALVHRENGKPTADAAIEITLAIDHIAWAGRHAAKVLGRRKVATGLLAANQSATVEYQPFGVVGVIGPWNYPVFTPMGSLAYALAAGNAVVFKPSEWTPAVGAWLVEAWKEAAPDLPDVVTLVTGMGPTGAALCRAGVDKIAFTGSARTGRAVMAACAENLVPVLMECGGKDALIVDDDADVDAAAEAALWGGMSNGGQTCIGIERVYATEQVYDRFVTALTERAAKLRPGPAADSSYGPATMPSQLDVVRRHIDDAIERGGRAVVGGPEAVHDGMVEPTVLVDVPEDSAAVQEETFGPTLTVARVANGDEAVERANATGYGLAGAVFSGSRQRGEELAFRLRSGMASVNSVLAFASVPGLPFGGVGESGFGRIHGPDGLREFARSKAVTSQRWALPVNLLSFERPALATDILARFMKARHGRGH
jgi:acyl-CoA reductase-like NAD-dependent aldehyde dehydrogenase